MVTSGPRPPRYGRASDLVRFMTRANRVDSTHIRLVVAHLADQRGALEALLDHTVLKEGVGLDITDEAWTVDALACELLGTGFLALTFSLRPKPERGIPTRSDLTRIPTEPLTQPAAAGFEDVTWEIFDTARRPTSVFDGTIRDEFLVQPLSFREAAVDVARLAVTHERPLFFVHAPAATPGRPGSPSDMTRPGLRFAVAFPRLDDAGRLDFGTDLVDLCAGQGYGLWQRTASAGVRSHGYWQQVVVPQVPAETVDEPAPAAGDGLAVTCIGPARVGSTEALLRVLTRAGAPLLGLSSLTLDDVSIMHLLTRAPRPTRTPHGAGHVVADVRADVALSAALGLDPPVVDDKLRDHRLVVSTHDPHPIHPGLAAIWLSWQAPATTDALRLTVGTLRTALDDVWARHCGGAIQPRSGHLNIEYVACRNTTSVDRLQGRMQVAVDLEAFGPAAEGGPRGTGADAAAVLSWQLGQFCSDVQHQWRQALSLALGTPYVDLGVAWRESRLEPMRAAADGDREG
jgi:hypothetical protein